VVARRADRLRALADELDGLEVMAADLVVDDDLAAVAHRLADPEQPVDLLVNDAGFAASGPLVELPAARVADQIRLNVVALSTLTHAVLPAMVARRRGWVLNVSSVAGFQPAPGLAVYAATKAYVTSFTESLHEELRGTGVRATALCPGLTRTEFIEISSGGTGPSRYPDMVWSTADEVARDGLRDVARGRALSVPGSTYRALVATSTFVPRGMKRRMAGLVRSLAR
jgi:short-subunit dehydrogenase